MEDNDNRPGEDNDYDYYSSPPLGEQDQDVSKHIK
jgi:hypothetical protein